MNNKLCLGTAQLGMKYGIKNEHGRKPTYQECFDILDCARENGIQYIDTASAYGEAETILGEFNLKKHNIKVISKLPRLENYQIGMVEEYVNKTLERLQADYVEGYMIHCAENFYDADLLNEFLKIKENGLIKNIGVSVYEPNDALNAVSNKYIDYIQIPYNVFDQRLDKTSFFELADKNNIRVFARSAFLQGLLLFDMSKIPSQLREIEPFLNRLDFIIREFDFSRIEAAFLFCYCNDNIDNVVFGVDNVMQLKDNIQILKKQNRFLECYNKLKGKFDDIGLNLIMPNLW